MPGTIVCTYDSTVTIQSNVVKVVLDTGYGRCVLGPPSGPSEEEVVLGRLAAGSYRIEVYHSWDGGALHFVESATLQVIEPASGPALGAVGLAALAIVLSVAGVLVLRSVPVE
ncbi:MAG: hypothetical protein WA208_02200 [Thermoanaerobaculia bacterium]